jgi:[amino group carrier protein]-L-2-aminoadipate 6-kinase
MTDRITVVKLGGTEGVDFSAICNDAGVNAFGLCGLDGKLLQAVRKDSIQSIENGKRKIIRDDYTGRIETVNHQLLSMLLTAGYMPVIAPVAVSEKGEALNVDADRAAAMVAAALKAETLILLTAVPGLMRNFPDESTLIRQLPQSQLSAASEAAQGRMKKKVLGAEEALKGGVTRVVIADGRIQNPISNALQGNGTVIQCTAL